MEQDELLEMLKKMGKDPSRLIFEDELTGINNRRFLGNYFEFKVDWDSLTKNPVSLIMIDLDKFKDINDTYGHQAGDQALVYIAELLKQAAGDAGIPVRYAGDEFMILLHGAGKAQSLAVAQNLLDMVHAQPCYCDEKAGEVRCTLSMGVATAPHDAAEARSLIQRADEALYHAKNTGRDRVVDASDTDPATAQAKAALLSRSGVSTSGRKGQLAQIVGFLRKFIQRQSQFVIVEGAPGMGKSTFLESIDRTIGKTSLTRVKVAGRAPELFRPYYLATDILLSLLDRQPDKGLEIIKGLSPEEEESLGFVLPQLVGGALPQPTDEAFAREMIFTTFLRLFPRLVDEKPLVILVDDLHMVDEATLLLFRSLLLKSKSPVFLCGATADPRQSSEAELTPVERFRAAYTEELSIGKIRLTPLTEQDVEEHMASIFSDAKLPEGMARELSAASQGNPLFLSEMIQKLVQDRKISRKSGSWVVQAPEQGYLPRSIEEIVSHKVASLDAESRAILDTVSAYGENVSLSVLTGTSEQREARVLEFLDKAVEQGLVSMEFVQDDEKVRILGSQVAKLVYGGIGSQHLESLHERIGNYQESLHQEGLIPSAAILAFHFQRSANLEKAGKYEQIQARHNSLVFDSREAALYSGEGPDILDEDEPLDDASMVRVPDLVRFFLIALRNTKLYPKGSDLTAKAIDRLFGTVDQILSRNPRIHLYMEEEIFFTNSQQVNTDEWRSTADTFSTLFKRLELKGIVLKQGLSREELFKMIEVLSKVDRKQIKDGFWIRLMRDEVFGHVMLRQVRYALKQGVAPAPVALTPEKGDQQDLGEQELRLAANVVRHFLGAASKMKLYPPDGPVAAVAIDQVSATLEAFFSLHEVLSLAQVGDALLVNGVRTEAKEFEKISEGFLRFLSSLGLNSITFYPQASKADFVAFFSAMKNAPRCEIDSAYWLKVAADSGMQGIQLNESVYAVAQTQFKADASEDEQPPQDEGFALQVEVPLHHEGHPTGDLQADAAAGELAKALDEQPEAEEISPDALVRAIREAVLGGNAKDALAGLDRLASLYAGADEKERQSLGLAFEALSQMSELGASIEFAQMLSEKALHFASDEGDFKPLSLLANAAREAGFNLVRLGAYEKASPIMGRLSGIKDNLAAAKDKLADAVDLSLPTGIQRLVAQDVVNADEARRGAAVGFLASLGQSAAEAFLDILRTTDDLRARQVAASFLVKGGQEAVARFKEDIVSLPQPEERVRLLEVADSITRDLAPEMAFAIEDSSAPVRQAGFALAERLGGKASAKLVLGYLGHEDEAVVLGAVRTLSRLNFPESADGLLALIAEAGSEKVQAAACSAIGQMGLASGVEALAKIILPRGFWIFKKQNSPYLRSAAAWALAKISDENALRVLGRLVNDKDARVREAARKAIDYKEDNPKR
ncbi:MAG: diguanylate cyclase [Desulfatibacillaceae bacterium]|nr:diguanylate cyclase [Desulfatibacillaceae bacterium]